MKNSNLVRILKAFDKKEMAAFKRFLDSPLHNQDDHVKALFERLRRNYPEFDSRQFSQESVFHSIFENERFNRNKLHRLMNKLKVLAEQFMTWLLVDQNKGIYHQLLMKAYHERGEFDFFMKVSEQRLQDLGEQKERDLPYHREMIRLSHARFFHQGNSKHIPLQKDLEQLIYHLNQYYWMAQLRYGCELLTRENILAISYNKPFLQQALDLSQQEPFVRHPLFMLYAQIGQLHQQGHQEELYQSTVALFFQHADLLCREEQAIVLQNLINHLTLLTRKTGMPKLAALRKLHLFGLDKGLFVYQGLMSSTAFINIVNTAAALQQFPETKNFIQQYAKYLLEEERADSIQIAEAFWHFYRGYWLQDSDAFNKSENCLHSSKAKTVLHEVLIRSLNIRILYEKNRRQSKELALLSLNSNLDSFEKFLRRNKKVNEHTKRSYLKFIAFTRRLIAYADRTNSSKYSTLQNEILESQNLVLKFWLLDKITELE